MFAGKECTFIVATMVICTIAVATVHITVLIRRAMSFPIVFFFFFIRLVLLRHIIIVARASSLPIRRSNAIRQLFSNFIVECQLKTVKNLAITIFWYFCFIFALCINYSRFELIAVLIVTKSQGNAMLCDVYTDFLPPQTRGFIIVSVRSFICLHSC